MCFMAVLELHTQAPGPASSVTVWPATATKASKTLPSCPLSELQWNQTSLEQHETSWTRWRSFVMSDVIITALWPLIGRLCCTYSDLVVDKLARHVHLLGWPSDGEDPGVVVSGGRGVPLQLHVSARLLVDAFDGFSTCTHSTRGKSTTILEEGVPTILCNTGRGIKTLQSNQVRQVHQPVQSGPNKTSELMRNWGTNTHLTVDLSCSFSHTNPH